MEGCSRRISDTSVDVSRSIETFSHVSVGWRENCGLGCGWCALRAEGDQRLTGPINAIFMIDSLGTGECCTTEGRRGDVGR